MATQMIQSLIVMALLAMHGIQIKMEGMLSDSSAPILHILDGLPQRVYSVFLERDAMPNGVVVFGSFSYGLIDQTNCKSDLSYVPLKFLNDFVTNAFDIQKFKMNNYVRQSTQTAQSDSGLAVILAPGTEFDNIYRQLNPDFDEQLGIYTLNCTNQQTQPDLTFTINNKDYSIPATEYLIDILLQDGRCAVAIGQSSQFTASWGLGNPFGRVYCTIFDIDQNRLGLATAIHNNQNFTPGPS
ncbi:Eukaryotic aspartyl protease [Aphelenchoides bicaudatus]|nr:Eukaryotic aspartyl protease [Aphelenchoides bicaudatus]